MVKMHFMEMTRILLCFLLCFSYSLQGKETKSVMKKSVSGQKLKYLISVPNDKPQKNGWPVLLFLHGAGERGNDLEKVKRGLKKFGFEVDKVKGFGKKRHKLIGRKLSSMSG